MGRRRSFTKQRLRDAEGEERWFQRSLLHRLPRAGLACAALRHHFLPSSPSSSPRPKAAASELPSESCLPVRLSGHTSVTLWLLTGVGYAPGQMSCKTNNALGSVYMSPHLPILHFGMLRAPKSQRSRDVGVRSGAEGLEGLGEKSTCFRGQPKTLEVRSRQTWPLAFPWGCLRHSVWQFYSSVQAFAFFNLW